MSERSDGTLKFLDQKGEDQFPPFSPFPPVRPSFRVQTVTLVALLESNEAESLSPEPGPSGRAAERAERGICRNLLISDQRCKERERRANDATDRHFITTVTYCQQLRSDVTNFVLASFCVP
jgi:hypothetical protein